MQIANLASTYRDNASSFTAANFASRAAIARPDDVEVGGAALVAPSEEGTADETVTLSNQARALLRGELPDTLGALTYGTPNRADAARQPSLSVRQPDAAMLDRLRQAGIATVPPFAIQIDPLNHRVSVIGQRPDAERIEALINGSPDLQPTLR